MSVKLNAEIHTPSGQTPPDRHTRWADTPTGQTAPMAETTADTTGYSQQVGSTHPTGMHSYLSLNISFAIFHH